MAPIRTVAASFWLTVVFVVALAAAAIAAGVRLFGLSIGGGMALFFVLWWLLLFAVLPFGSRSQSDAGDVTPGTDPGAPALPALREKAIWTTLAACAVFLGVAAWLPLSGL